MNKKLSTDAGSPAIAASGGPSIDFSNVDSTICFTGVLSISSLVVVTFFVVRSGCVLSTEFVSKFGSLSSSGCSSLDVSHDFGGSSVVHFFYLST